MVDGLVRLLYPTLFDRVSRPKRLWWLDLIRRAEFEGRVRWGL